MDTGVRLVGAKSAPHLGHVLQTRRIAFETKQVSDCHVEAIPFEPRAMQLFLQLRLHVGYEEVLPAMKSPYDLRNSRRNLPRVALAVGVLSILITAAFAVGVHRQV